MKPHRLALLSIVAASCGRASPEGPGPFVYDDLSHSRKQNRVDYRLDPDTFAYQGAYAYARLFDRLEIAGVTTLSLDETLDDTALEGFDALFINLVSEDRPDFEPDEIAAVEKFVTSGGGLFVIADHSNAYGHAERLNRLLARSGLEVMLHTAVETDESATVEGLGWLLVSRFADHPVTRGLGAISLQTGGPIRGGTGLAFTTEHSFADLWDPNDPDGHYGDWEHGDQEPAGPLAVVASTEWGSGRVLIVGDQNIFGDGWLYFADNFALAANAFDWVLGRAPGQLASSAPPGILVGLDQKHAGSSAGHTDPGGFHGLFLTLNRNARIDAHARFELEPDDRLTILTDALAPFSEGEISTIRASLSSGSSLFVLGETPAARALLAALDPSYPGAGQAREPSQEPLRSDVVDVDGLEVPVSEAELDWGERLIWTGRGDVARKRTVGGGDVIVFPRSVTFANSTLGDPTRPPEVPDAHTLVTRLVDWATRAK